jgi:hypothetical protein
MVLRFQIREDVLTDARFPRVVGGNLEPEWQGIWLYYDEVVIVQLDITEDQLALLIEQGELTEVRLRRRRRYDSDEVTGLKKRSRG